MILFTCAAVVKWTDREKESIETLNERNNTKLYLNFKLDVNKLEHNRQKTQQIECNDDILMTILYKRILNIEMECEEKKNKTKTIITLWIFFAFKR